VRIAGDVSLGKTVVLRIDATLVQAHSKKQQAAATYRKGFGHHPLGCWISNTGELAALMLRPGNAGANTAADLITVLRQAIGQVPARWRDRLLVTSDGAGFSHELINWLTAQNHAADRHVEYSIGWPIDADTRAGITTVRKDCWLPAVDNLDGSVRDDLQVAELTSLLRDRLARGGWPARLRVFVRRRRLPPGQQHTLFDLDGYAYSAFATNTASGMSIQLLDARHRGHARVEDDVRTTKDTGLAHLPSHSFAVNQAWCTAVSIAVDLLAWLRLLGPPQLARCEPATLRYRVLHVPARLTHGQRRRWLRLPAGWPWARAIAEVIATIRAIPLPRPQPG
jgi:hypothetical protein